MGLRVAVFVFATLWIMITLAPHFGAVAQANDLYRRFFSIIGPICVLLTAYILYATFTGRPGGMKGRIRKEGGRG